MRSSPWLPVATHQAHEGLHLRLGDVLLQQLAVVVEQGGDGVLGQDVVADLALHHAKLLGYVFLFSTHHASIIYTYTQDS